MLAVSMSLKLFLRFPNGCRYVKSFCSSATTLENTSGDVPGAEEGRMRTVPIVTSRSLQFLSKAKAPAQAWVENLDTITEQKLGLVDLHPDVFAAVPRIDIVHQNWHWQRMYKFVCFAHTKVRAEVRGGGRKPWPQKGLGRARHGSIRSPLWRGGGVVHGPRSPTPHFYMLPLYKRIYGLTSMLSIKLAQDDLHIVDSLDIPSEEPEYIQDLVESRNWGPSVLLVDVTECVQHVEAQHSGANDGSCGPYRREASLPPPQE
ncbi:large ribosomal subunit protein uL4m isoform X2 [Anabrus simplex]|uniref:large ribosomal subunit protein uL4m isoform X2 n=1 Tax=Anabrus simplex TaxID=316456 RepID=UPI0034DD0DFD